MSCKLCDGILKETAINLGIQPLANKYPSSKSEIEIEQKYPMKLDFCENCISLQMQTMVSRETMFSEYYYLSSVNTELVEHFKNLASTLKEKRFVIDVGSNDGILLDPLSRLGVKNIGIDPSVNVGALANEKGLKTIIGFFNEETAAEAIRFGGRPDCIVASSIFTHLEQPDEFARLCSDILAPEGTLIVEVEYLPIILNDFQFERFYFDRPFYYSATSLNKLFSKFGMEIKDVAIIVPHGGSLRATLGRVNEGAKSASVDSLIADEEKINYSSICDFNRTITQHASTLKEELQRLASSGQTIFGYGAPARLATISNFCDLGPDLIQFVVDDSPLKQNRFSPGKHIPILDSSKLDNSGAQICVVFAYEYFDSIYDKTSQLGLQYYKAIPFSKIEMELS